RVLWISALSHPFAQWWVSEHGLRHESSSQIVIKNYVEQASPLIGARLPEKWRTCLYFFGRLGHMTRDAALVASSRPLRRDAELNRRRIRESARVVFGLRGLDATLDDIAHHAGLGVGTVYRRFPSKEHLIEAMFAERLHQISALAERALAANNPWQGFVDFTWQ